jgi:signal transduction histidine kinase
VKGLLTGLDAGIYLAESGLQQEDLNRIREGVATMRGMVEQVRGLVLDVLYFAKERPLERRPVDALVFTEGLVAAARSKVAKHGIRFETEIGADLGSFEVDEAVFAPAILNLIENAVDACAERPGGPEHRITLRVRGTPHEVAFEVEDDGIGMSPEVQGNIFNLFFSSKGRAGTGLGLFITRQVIAQHGGRITVASAPGRGSCFRLALPRRAAPAAADADGTT